MTHWKFLTAGGLSPFAVFSWTQTAGKWVEAESAEGCRTGIHACRAEDLPYWLTDELWAIELETPIAAGHKVVAKRARLGEQVRSWTPDVAHELALACIARIASHASAELRTAGLADEARDLLALSEESFDDAALGSLGDLAASCAERAAAAQRRPAATLALYVTDAVELLDDCPVATIAYIAARAANQRSEVVDDDPYGVERQWQATWLATRLVLETP